MKKANEIIDNIKKTKIKISLKEFDNLVNLINDLEKKLKESKEEILKFNNVDMKEDLKFLINNNFIQNMLNYNIDFDGDYWYKLNINLNKDIISSYKLNDFVVIRFKNEVSLYGFLKSKFKGIDINKFNRSDKTLSFSDDTLDIVIFNLKDINKHMIIYKIFEVRDSINFNCN